MGTTDRAPKWSRSENTFLTIKHRKGRKGTPHLPPPPPRNVSLQLIRATDLFFIMIIFCHLWVRSAPPVRHDWVILGRRRARGGCGAGGTPLPRLQAWGVSANSPQFPPLAHTEGVPISNPRCMSLRGSRGGRQMRPCLRAACALPDSSGAASRGAA